VIDADAFSAALRPLLPRSAGYAYAFLNDRPQAEDAVQQAALKAWERRAQYDPALPFRSWWFTILRNCCLDLLRARKRTPVPLDIADANPAAPGDESAMNRRALDVAMARLSDMHREILMLRYHGDLDYIELAEVLAIPNGTVMSRLHLARKALTAIMTRESHHE
jgi:RNA polymerase sigma-70 factor, ECF subfamily